MQIVTGTNIYNNILDASVVTIGNFDGVHCGHAEIFSHLKQKSMDLNLPAVVVTFEPHPLKVLVPEAAPMLITTFNQKCALIEQYGIDYLIVIPFSLEFSQVSAKDFVRTILCGSLGMRHIIIGHDYAFGKKREGNFTTLEQLGESLGFTLEDLPPIGVGGIVFSSSLARSAIADGDVAAASRVLGRCYQISGSVVHGREIGKTLGFPTANIAAFNELLPAEGVYAVMVQVDGDLVQGACNIGCNPTFGSNIRTVEVFLFDFTRDIYDHAIEISFVQRLRSVQKFPDLTALKAQINRDVQDSRTILDNLDMNSVKNTAQQVPCAN